MNDVQIARDELTRRLYANDASIYEQMPAGVCVPRSAREVVALVRWAAAHGVSLTARAGGTSLAGQATGGGVIVDVSRYVTRIREVDATGRWAWVEPGVIRDALNRQVARLGLHFAPDTSTTDRCAVGGMIGNNSAGLYSVRHGSTRDHVLALRVVLSDGSEAVFGPKDDADEAAGRPGLEGRIYRQMLDLVWRHADLIRRAYPDARITRRNTGYALDRLLTMRPFAADGEPFNLAALLCGSEGTLALTLEAQVRLTPMPARRVLVAPHFEQLDAALRAAGLAVEAGCAAAELIDDKILDAALQNRQQAANRGFVVGTPRAMLLVEFQGDEAERQAQDFAGNAMQGQGRAYAAPVLTDAAAQARAWALRKAGLGLLMGTQHQQQTPEFIEDTAVQVTDLPAYVADVQALMAREGVECVYYGHASVGELHLRPLLDLHQPEGQSKVLRIAEAMADLVAQYRGSLSGEHGDGRIRAPYIERVLGTEMMPVLAEVKRIWDPENLLNPGKIVHAAPMLTDLRPDLPDFSFSVPSAAAAGSVPSAGSVPTTPTPDAFSVPAAGSVPVSEPDLGGGDRSDGADGPVPASSVPAGGRFSVPASGSVPDAAGRPVPTGFAWRDSGGFAGALRRCNGAGVCRKRVESGGVMCPSYHVTGAEIDSTRGRANLFRQLFQGKRAEAFGDQGLQQALSLCLGCKACMTECPASVDMARMKAEFLHGWLQQKGQTPMDRVLGQPERWLRAAGWVPRGLLERLATSPGLRQRMERHWGLAAGRALPLPARRSFYTAARAYHVRQQPNPTVVLLPDPWMNWLEPRIGWAMIRVLEAFGARVAVLPPMASVRSRISSGLLDEARQVLRRQLTAMAVWAERGVPMLGAEPSEVLAYRDDVLDLVSADELPRARRVAEQTLLLEEWLATQSAAPWQSAPATPLTVHGHCHMKALAEMDPLLDCLRQAGYAPHLLEAGCCGMAGRFGYDAETYAMSMQVGELQLFPALRGLDVTTAQLCAPGFSCREQMRAVTPLPVRHPAEWLADRLRGGFTDGRRTGRRPAQRPAE
jgi:FAD/FMN-containing dehydrogenase/Fe-S oxidoreductase